MRILPKLQILLLGIALAPLLIFLWFGQEAGLRMGNELANQTREVLRDNAEASVLRSVEEHGRLLQLQHDMLAQNLRYLAGAAEQAMRGVPPADPDVSLYTQFDPDADPQAPPPPAAFERLAFAAAPGAEQLNTVNLFSRLSTLLPTCLMIHRSQDEQIYRIIVVLEQGAFTFYPGIGRYPEGHDPRAEQWYTDAVAEQALVWRSMLKDPLTGQAIMCAAMPIHPGNPEIGGVVCIQVRIVDALRQVKLPDRFDAMAEAMLVLPSEGGGQVPEHGLYVVASKLDTAQQSWAVAPGLRRLVSKDEAELEKVWGDCRAGKSGTRRMEYDNRDCLWAYAPLHGTDSALLVTVPLEDVLVPARRAESSVRDRVHAQRNLVLALSGGAVLIVLVLSIPVSRQVTRPIENLAEAADRIAAGDFETPVDVSGSDEVGQLGRSMNAMLPQLRERVEMRQALGVAQDVQQSLLPADPPRVTGFDIHGASIYCDETGGDYYDFFHLPAGDESRLAVVIGDVSGHGVGSALEMATVRAVLRSHADEVADIAELLNHVNKHVYTQKTMSLFTTLSLMTIELADRTVRWGNAGHEPPALFDPTTGQFESLSSGGIPLGVEPDWEFEKAGPKQLTSGQLVYFGTDGIWEARDPDGDFFGMDRLHDIIRRNQTESAASIVQAVINAVTAHRAGSPQKDDITLVVVKVL